MEKRELIEKPKYYGAPMSWVENYFQGSLRSFRQKHQQFDLLLIELGRLLKASNKNVYKNLIKFIDGEAEPNWISPTHSMFTVFIKLYNYHLSAEEAFDYIEECNKVYYEMYHAEYEFERVSDYSIRHSRWDGNPKDFLEVVVIPKKEIENEDKRYWFDVTTSSLVSDEYVMYMPDVKIEARGKKDSLLEDTLCLLENYQHRILYKKVFDAAIDGLIDKGIFVLDDEYEKYDNKFRQFKVVGGLIEKLSA